VKRTISSALSLVVLLLAAPVALANAGPPRVPPSVTEPSVALAAVAGVAGAVLAGWWLARRPRP
jgi:hypothetical protein